MSPSMTPPTSSARVKLRAACNLCHAAKVRCSGEKTGCVRCVGQGQECVYAESRVGKVQGSRSRQNRAQSESNSSSVIVELPPSSNPNTAAAPNNSETENSGNSHLGDSPVIGIDWTGSSDNFGNTSLMNDGHDCPSSKTPGLFDSREFSPFDIADITSFNADLELEQIHTPALSISNDSSLLSSSHNNSLSLSSQPYSMELDTYSNRYRNSPQTISSLPQGRRNESQSILACTKIVEFLELRIQSGISAIDGVMEINKASVCEISQLIDIEECKRSIRCLTLISIAMDQVLSLYEAGCINFHSDTNPQRNFFSGGNSSRPCLPNLGLGTFQIDPEEQKAIWAQVLVKEISRSKGVLQRLGDGLRLHGMADCHEQRQQSLESRLRALISSLKT